MHVFEFCPVCVQPAHCSVLSDWVEMTTTATHIYNRCRSMIMYNSGRAVNAAAYFVAYNHDSCGYTWILSSCNWIRGVGEVSNTSWCRSSTLRLGVGMFLVVVMLYLTTSDDPSDVVHTNLKPLAHKMYSPLKNVFIVFSNLLEFWCD